MTTELQTGKHGAYRSLDWNDGCDVNMGDVIRRHPELVLGRYVVIVTSDSGRYTLIDEEINLGWKRIGDLAISPMISDVAQLPTPGFDEWYIFDELPEPARLSRLNREVVFSPLGEGAQVDDFWRQIVDLKPVHALEAACPSLLLVTRDADLYEAMVVFYSDF